jgi:hypothetical protein
MTTVAHMIWGTNYEEAHGTALSRGKSGPQNMAQEALDAMVNPEFRRVVDAIEQGMQRGNSPVFYELMDHPDHDGEYTAAHYLKKRVTPGTYLFSDECISGGILHGLAGLIEAAHPGYVCTQVSAGRLEFRT